MSARERREGRRIEQRYKTARTLILVLVFLGCVWVIGDAIGDLAGKETNVAVSLLFSIFADLKFALSVALAGGMAAWAVVERWLRHRKVDRLQGRIRGLEKRIDPGRSTSGLTTKGQTHPRRSEEQTSELQS